jgi:hypothetical protein
MSELVKGEMNGWLNWATRPAALNKPALSLERQPREYAAKIRLILFVQAL